MLVVLFALVSGSFALLNPCSGSFSTNTWCDTTLSTEDRVAALVAAISTSDQLGLFVNGASGVSSVNIAPYQWWNEALHGVAYSPGVSYGSAIPYSTSFPQVMGTGSSFNTTLFHLIGETISTEARAFYNYNQADLTFWAPNINIFRDPRWGRGQETPGEDPYLSSEYVFNFVTGMQGVNLTNPESLKVSSCCKHYDAYSLENWGGVDRHHFNAIVTPQDFADTYFPVFEACANRGNASGVMCSYNAVNGIPSCADYFLLTEHLRNDWGFNGYVTSDCGAVNDVQYSHQYTNTTDETCEVVLAAGMDVECGNFFSSNLAGAVNDNAVSTQQLDTALTHLFNVQFRLGIFDPPTSSPYAELGPNDVNTAASQQLALEAAQQTVVLLQNKNNVLPFSTSSIKTIAAIGPNANGTTLMLGNYFGNPQTVISPIAGLATYASVNFQFGCSMTGTDTSGFAAAQQAASSSDATVIFVGLDQTQESEGNDRTSIALPGVQNQLISAVASSAKGPVVVFVISGGTVDLSAVVANPDVDAIVYACYGGQAGGQGYADNLFGTHNPSGRLTQTWYLANYTDLSMFDMGMRPNASSGNPGRGYRFFTGPSVFQFGDGLSYTTFSYDWVYDSKFSLSQVVSDLKTYAVVPSEAPAAGVISVNVTNTGSVAGSDSVLLFLSPPNAGQDGNPIQFLAGFEKIFLAPGQYQVVDFPLTATQLAVANELGEMTAVPGTWTARVGSTKKTFQL